MERIGRLQEKNSDVLDSYVEQQKMLVELNFLRKIYPKVGSHTH
jgi:hypothetical protein